MNGRAWKILLKNRRTFWTQRKWITKATNYTQWANPRDCQTTGRDLSKMAHPVICLDSSSFTEKWQGPCSTREVSSIPGQCLGRFGSFCTRLTFPLWGPSGSQHQHQRQLQIRPEGISSAPPLSLPSEELMKHSSLPIPPLAPRMLESMPVMRKSPEKRGP